MKETYLEKRTSPVCDSENLRLSVVARDEVEVRKGSIYCAQCNKQFIVAEGIVDMRYDLPEAVMNERRALNEKTYFIDCGKTCGFIITGENDMSSVDIKNMRLVYTREAL